MMEMKKELIKQIKPKKNKIKNIIDDYWIVALLLVILIVFLWLNSLNPVLVWDENVYLGNARSHLTPSYFTEDFRSPLLEYIIAGAWLVTGESVFTARLTIILFSLGIIFVFYLISKRLFKNALVPTLLFAISSEFIFWGFRIYTDSVSLFFVLLAFYLFIREKRCLYVLSGFFAALSFLTRFPLALFALSVGVYCLIKRKWKPLLLFCTGFLIGVLPWLIYNFLIYNNPLWDVFALFSAVNQYTQAQPPSLLLLSLAKSLFMLILFLPLGIYGLINIRKKKIFDYWMIIIIYTIISLIYYLFFVKLKLMRYNLVIVPFLILLSCLGLVEMFRMLKVKKMLSVVIIIIIICLMLIPLKTQINVMKYKGECNQVKKQALDYVKNNTRPGDTVLGNEWVGYGYCANLKAFSLWNHDIDKLIELYAPHYVIYHSKGGISYNLSNLEESNQVELEKVFKGECYEIMIFKSLSIS